MAVSMQVHVQGELLAWARERSRRDPAEVAHKYPKLDAWERGEANPTLTELEAFANYTHTPIGYFFLDEPPEETLPIPDFRTMRAKQVRRPSADLLDTIYACQQRQAWYRDYAVESGLEPVDLVGSLTTDVSEVDAAEVMRTSLMFDVRQRGSQFSDAFSRLKERAEALGVLAMTNGVVGNNTRRKLDPDEFRGFALIDEYAPVIFINGADTVAAKIFTLVHELAHVWLGQSGVDDAHVDATTQNSIERWCNSVAGEFLVPRNGLRAMYRGDISTAALDQLALSFKVSTLVLLHRLYDVGLVGWDVFRETYVSEEQRLRGFMAASAPGGDGGNPYNTIPSRASRRLTKAVLANTLEGGTSYSDAMSLLGVRNPSVLENLAQRLGVQ